MEGESEITVKDWIEHLHWVIDNIEIQRNHNEKFRIPILTFFILSLLTCVASIINSQWIYVFLSVMGVLFSTLMTFVLNEWNYQSYKLSNEIAILLNDILIHDDIEIDDIRIEFMQTSSKYASLGEKSQKRLEELKRKKNPNNK